MHKAEDLTSLFEVRLVWMTSLLRNDLFFDSVIMG